MKNISLIILLFTFSFCYSQDWKLIGEVSNDTYYYKPNTRDTAWIKVVSEKTEYESKESQKLITVDGYKLILQKFNCRNKKLGTIEMYVYSEDGKLLDSYKEEEIFVQMDYVIPDTLGEDLLQTFCKLN